MIVKPTYFELIRRQAAELWDLLEHKPEVAGPWHQLFKQVQSPRHIVSELLQNADDAGATEASVCVENGSFVFTHNGEDFTEEHFASLCRFGYSNKRALHTIGFRGVGFKSTFSLGDTVELYTSTLSVAFDRQRFTEPRWVDSALGVAGSTKIRVAKSDDHRMSEVETNLQEWLKSPLSLLFFKHLRQLRISDHDLNWCSLGPGPAANTEWMALYKDPDREYLVARSEYEPFPFDALDEIRKERLLVLEQETDFPPCRVEIVLGATGRLYVVLPTGVTTPLPFASNGPFIQDPARVKIKDPSTSPTNRWIFKRIGALAATVMLQWLGNTTEPLAERARAYGFLPDVDRKDNSLEGTSATSVELAFEAAITGKAFLLADSGGLNTKLQCVIIPEDLFDVWPAEQISALLDPARRPALSRHIAAKDRNKLVHWGLVETIERKMILSVLQTNHLPKPLSWQNLLRLWAWVAPEVTSYRSEDQVYRQIRVIPVNGKDALYAASEVVRLGERRLLQSDADWDFLSTRLLVLDQSWTLHLAKWRREAYEREDKVLRDSVDRAYAVLNSVGLEETSDVNKVFEQVALSFFQEKSITRPSCVRLAQIAAKLGAIVGESFRFISRNTDLRSTKDVLLFDGDGTLEGFFPENWCSTHLLHPDYSKSFDSCTTEEWSRWISSEKAGLRAFAPLVQQSRRINGRPTVEAYLRSRGYFDQVRYYYKNSNEFTIEDWDFETALWSYWTTLAKTDIALWVRLVERILGQKEEFWSSCQKARTLQIGPGWYNSTIADSLLPAWTLKLRELPCLSDTRGFSHKPADLLRRTRETEPFLDVETFVDSRVDTEATRPLLELLGVRDKPTGPDRLLDCLRALAKAEKPPTQEVDKWYRRLDQVIETCSTNDRVTISNALRFERIVLTEYTGWDRASNVFLTSDEEDVPGTPIVRASVRELTLWRKINVAERPTADAAIQWLSRLPTGQALPSDDSRRLRSLMARHPARVWNECHRWLNLAGEWVPTTSLSYALTMQTLVPWTHLHPWVKQKTADFQSLRRDITAARPFCDLPHLASQIAGCFNPGSLVPGRPERKPWLSQLGSELRRIVLDDEAETVRIRTLAGRLSATVWQIASGIETIPYVDGIPAGTPRREHVVWLDGALYIAADLPNAKLASLVPDKIGKLFGRTDISAALSYSYGRSPDDVTEYLEENFRLAPPVAAATAYPDEPTTGEASAAQRSLQEESEAELDVATPVDESNPIAATSSDDTNGLLANKQGSPEARGGEKVSPPRPRTTTKPSKPRIIERFAFSQNFQKDGEGRFFHRDGSWIAKTVDEPFPWERRSRTGAIVRYYWTRDHCLENEPLELPADVWGLIDKFPETHSLILANPQDEPVETTGARAREMRDDGTLTLYPATYRLVYRDVK